jgi:hypothetical protein
MEIFVAKPVKQSNSSGERPSAGKKCGQDPSQRRRHGNDHGQSLTSFNKTGFGRKSPIDQAEGQPNFVTKKNNILQ